MSQGNSPVPDLGRRGAGAPELAVGTGLGTMKRVLTQAEIEETAPFIPKTHDAVITALTNEARARCEQ